jgi:hypothetical protein
MTIRIPYPHDQQGELPQPLFSWLRSVNNAGFSWFGPTADLDVATFDRLFAPPTSGRRASWSLGWPRRWRPEAAAA